MKSKLIAALFSFFLACQPTVADADQPIAETPDVSAAPLVEAVKIQANVAHIVFTGDVDPGSSKAIVDGIDRANAAPADDAIILEINSGGGQMDPGFLIAKAIENSAIPVICVVDGDSASDAFYILQSCQHRLMTDRSELMIHEPSLHFPAGSSMNRHALRFCAKRLDVLTKSTHNHWTKKLKISRAEFEASLNRNGDWWLDSDEALRIGAVDGVAPSVKAVEDSVRAQVLAHKLEAALPQ